MFLLYVCAQLLSHVQLFVVLELRFSKLLCLWDSPGKNSRMACHFLLQGIFLTQGSNPYLLYILHWQADSLPLTTCEAPRIT